MTKRTVEETYQKLTQKEHVLKRPGMYIGSVDKTMEELWVKRNDSEVITKNMVEYTPGFIKIFDEVLTNALDHSARDPTVTFIKVDYSKNTGEITVLNNGTGIPVVLHKEHNMYVPELIFGHLLSGSNYDDQQQRTGAGQFGIGIKCSNIYSKRFVVETVDSENSLKFIQEFSDNMTDKTKPKITKCSVKSYTKITFLPDYTRFHMKHLEDDTISIINKRVYDCIACTRDNVQIYLNGEKLRGKGLQDYTNYFFPKTNADGSTNSIRMYHEKIVDRDLIWEFVVVPSERFEHVSFVNGNSTYQGGKHVDHIVYQIINRLKTLLETKKRIKDVKPAFIKERLFLFLRATVINPSFSSQTKEVLTTQVKDFGCRIEIPDKFIERLWKSSIIEDVVEFCKMKESLDVAKKTDGVKRNKIYIPKLEDALWAGTAKSDQCTLILTEGLSAMTFALWGRSIVGPERWGTVPLKGKILNIRDANASQLINNEEINNLKQILGLKHGKDYKDTKELRYGKVMLLTDADCDGSHIKGLLINLFHYWWPSLLKMDFLQTLRTPIVKAIRGQKTLEFYTEQDYRKWQSTVDTRGYQIKYFKGLGTSKKEDAQQAFRDIERLRASYYYKDAVCDESIELAFEKDKNTNTNRSNTSNTVSTETVGGATEIENTSAVDPKLKCSDRRKRWLAKYNRNSYIDAKTNRVSYQEFVHKELIHFSIYDNLRSIPSLCDGLKPSQRKILHYMMKNSVTKTIKVAQLSGYVSAETGYHHGEVSLQGAIINMAQNFVGSNNINLLYPDGNFGSRLNGGKDAASPRYIFTKLCNVTQQIFDKRDSPLLRYLNDDGIEIEPEWFLPVIPMVLVNGCEGIGTGYSTFIPPYNPRDIISNLLRVLNDATPLPMSPYYRGFRGELRETEPGSYVTLGKWEKITDTQIRITELPVGVAVTPYKEFLESMIDSNTTKTKAKKDAAEGTKRTKRPTLQLKDVQNKTRDENTEICFIVEFCRADDLSQLIETGTLEKTLKLSRSINTGNMYLFSEDLILTKYNSVNDILLDFYDIRIEFYGLRKQYIIQQLTSDLTVLNAKIRFINEYINGDLDINRKNRAYITDLLKRREYPMISTVKNSRKESSDDGGDSDVGSYDYLIRMQLISLSAEKITELETERDRKQRELDTIRSKTERDLWRDDLENLLQNTDLN